MKKNFCKIIYPFFLFSFVLLLSLWTKSYLTEDFSLYKILSSPKKNIENGTLFFPKEALTQMYRYIGKGHHSYAFGSEDGRYVLKFFRMNKFSSSFFHSLFFNENNQSSRFKFILNCYQMAFEKLEDLSGILYVHFEKTQTLPAKIVLKDKFIQKYPIDLNDTFFILQRKVEPFKLCLNQALKNKDLSESKLLIENYLLAIIKRSERGVMNKDRKAFGTNFGVLLGTHNVIEIDMGGMMVSEKVKTKEGKKEELVQCSQYLRKYLQKKENSLVNFLDQRIEKLTY